MTFKVETLKISSEIKPPLQIKMECELCYKEDLLEYDQDSLIKHLINDHLAKRTKALEIHVKTISDLEKSIDRKRQRSCEKTKVDRR